ncbi:glycosyltransferase family 4 protein [Tessaracoccus antarcticus]|uniref:Glycosyltransferase family 1 protein n=1 Tax=Tessaracoccus antarcticus TaxID=2479848 RepID=A0A3M0GL67_9ACTN|nr:glycosyltransferase family 4 protein [Tessaracoccus antarcticus]RMB61889.1 glycosyltransferase family 1 protein [Tessaracoccus antarcticus]
MSRQNDEELHKKTRLTSRRGHVAPRLVYGVGVGVSAFALMRGQLGWFSAAGWDVTLACTPDDEALLTVDREHIAFHGIPTERNISPAADVRALYGWLRLLRRLRPDAVNVGTPKAGLLAGLAAWITRVPKRIYVVRGLRLEGTKGLFLKVLWVMEWISAAVATDVVVVSRSLAHELLDRKLVTPRKAWLIGRGSSNGVDASRIASRAAEVDRSGLRREIGFSEETLVVGFVGRVSKDKGVGTLIQAFASGRLLPNIELLLIGAVEDPALAASTETLGDRVKVLPWTSDLWGTLPVLDVLCLPTRREGFPNVVLEAASAGIPTVTTRATGAIDSIVDGETGILVDVDDSEGLVVTLNMLADDASLVQRLGKAARERAVNDFQPETIWRGLADILSDRYEAEGLTRLDRLGELENDEKKSERRH